MFTFGKQYKHGRTASDDSEDRYYKALNNATRFPYANSTLTGLKRKFPLLNYYDRQSQTIVFNRLISQEYCNALSQWAGRRCQGTAGLFQY